ncbi:hypothetical protein [Cupriavidus sp. OTU4895]|uniref:hypothetical protein n=1 Tax=Cupriavidus sp. OTU4895 TaxID=3043852 RepID=UPI00313D25B5
MRVVRTLSMRQALLIVLVFTVMISAMLVIIDLTIIPLIKEATQNYVLRKWCGFINECGGGSMATLIDYVRSGDLWRNTVDFDAFWLRFKKAVAFGFMLGVSWIFIFIFKK